MPVDPLRCIPRPADHCSTMLARSALAPWHICIVNLKLWTRERHRNPNIAATAIGTSTLRQRDFLRTPTRFHHTNRSGMFVLLLHRNKTPCTLSHPMSHFTMWQNPTTSSGWDGPTSAKLDFQLAATVTLRLPHSPLRASSPCLNALALATSRPE